MIEADRSRRPGTSIRISTETMRDHFRGMLDEDDDALPHPDSEAVSAWLKQVEPIDAPDQDMAEDTVELIVARRQELLGVLER